MRALSKKILLIILLSVAFDQATKIWSERNLLVRADPADTRIYQGSREPIWEFGSPSAGINSPASESWAILQFNYVRNHGAAWGSFSKLDESIRLPLFHVLTAIFCTFFMGLALSAGSKLSFVSRLALGLMVAGAAGNLIDRLVRGYVIDLFDLRWQLMGWRYVLPVFNIADVCVVFGLVALVITALRR